MSNLSGIKIKKVIQHQVKVHNEHVAKLLNSVTVGLTAEQLDAINTSVKHNEKCARTLTGLLSLISIIEGKGPSAYVVK